MVPSLRRDGLVSRDDGRGVEPQVREVRPDVARGLNQEARAVPGAREAPPIQRGQAEAGDLEREGLRGLRVALVQVPREAVRGARRRADHRKGLRAMDHDGGRHRGPRAVGAVANREHARRQRQRERAVFVGAPGAAVAGAGAEGPRGRRVLDVGGGAELRRGLVVPVDVWVLPRVP